MANDFRFLMYNSPEENVSINAVVKDETIWLSQKAMAELFEKDGYKITKRKFAEIERDNIEKHAFEKLNFVFV